MCAVVGMAGYEISKYIKVMNNCQIYRDLMTKATILIEKIVCISMRRPSIIDLQNRHQPIYNEELVWTVLMFQLWLEKHLKEKKNERKEIESSLCGT